jgi:DHA3 family macrolide efflux protein-like MFS transporter
MEPKQKPGGVRSFFIIWIGQLVSLLGSQLTGFTLSVYVYDQTKSVMFLALAQIANQVPYVLFSPIAGVLADRWNRRTAMMVSDFGAGISVAIVAVLYFTGVLRPWMVIPINLIMAAFNSLMWPSYTAAVTLLVPKKHYGRANGFVQLGEALPQIAGPALAGALYVTVKLGNIAMMDFASYFFAVVLMLLFVRIPNPPKTEDGEKSKGNFWQEMRFGWDYIVARKELVALLAFFVSINFLSGIMSPLYIPVILDTWDPQTMGNIITIMGIGMLVGTLVMSAWGGGKRKIYTLLGSAAISGVFLTFGFVRPSIPLLAVCGFMFMFAGPFTNACSQSIWQSKVAPDVQGKVFAVRRAIAWSVNIVAPLLAAPLADYIFKPAMTEGGSLSGLLGPIFGVGASRGVAVLISVTGILSFIAPMVAMGIRRIRRIELDLPDHEIAATAETPVQ